MSRRLVDLVVEVDVVVVVGVQFDANEATGNVYLLSPSGQVSSSGRTGKQVGIDCRHRITGIKSQLSNCRYRIQFSSSANDDTTTTTTTTVGRVAQHIRTLIEFAVHNPIEAH